MALRRRHLNKEPLPSQIKAETSDQRTRLKQISVKKLFNRFDYMVNLCEDQNDVSILIAPNGCGKTTMLRFLNFLFSPTIQEVIHLSRLPFEYFECTLSNENRIVLYPTEFSQTELEQDYDLTTLTRRERIATEESQNSTMKKKLILECFDSQNKSLATINLTKLAYESADNDLLDFVNFDIDVNDFAFLRPNDSEYYSDNEILVKSNIQLKNDLISELNTYQCAIDVKLIRANRLQKHTYDLGGRENEELEPLDIAQRNMKCLCQSIFEAYNARQSEAKDALPREFLEAQSLSDAEKEKLEKDWKDYYRSLNEYIELGLFDNSNSVIKSDFFLKKEELHSIIDKDDRFMAVYLKLFEPTLDSFKDYMNKFKLFKKIFDERNALTGKTLKYTKDGFVITYLGKELPLEYLSSGEKNDFVMFFNLIFKSDDINLLLIDEPEISLHIEWQETYLAYLIAICKETHKQAIVATHSPNIICDHVDLISGLENIAD